MNQGSDIKLALAVQTAGAFPSLWVDYSNNELTKSNFDQLKSNNILIPIVRETLSDHKTLELIDKYNISHCELLATNKEGDYNDLDEWLNLPTTIAALKFIKRKTKIILRLRDVIDITKYPIFDAFSLKGSDSAGKTGTKPVREFFKEMIDRYPQCSLIPMGGVGTAEDVQWYMNNGALAVGVGTLFALCEESPLTQDVKTALISKTKSITNLPDTKQNCVILADKLLNESEWNRPDSLKRGIEGDGTQGHIYMGHGLKNVTHVRSCEELVNYLISKL